MVQAGGVAGEQLRSFVERIERLEEEKKGIAEDIKEIYASAKSVGFDVKILRQVIRVRKMDQADRQEQEALLDVYLHAIEGGEQVRSTAEVMAEEDA
ncbi:DUF2312 domain-containing protein [Kordiimonas lipolytica]|uniref:UPF0335 protein ACFO5Q_15785 n=1 Tax=Kordiimonas lipolytica TaxID=1662421 RepID=A0ABV8UDH8_9PROT|nr:DUF2312 domain-containing protein [Kordiimonas lipolytica]